MRLTKHELKGFITGLATGIVCEDMTKAETYNTIKVAYELDAMEGMEISLEDFSTKVVAKVQEIQRKAKNRHCVVVLDGRGEIEYMDRNVVKDTAERAVEHNLSMAEYEGLLIGSYMSEDNDKHTEFNEFRSVVEIEIQGILTR